MNNAMFDQHPGTDQLSDFAAGVVPPTEARLIENHVMACPRCAQLLADAERVRTLLAPAGAGPMPHDVWTRLDSAFAAEAAAWTTSAPPQPGYAPEPGYESASDSPGYAPEPGYTAPAYTPEPGYTAPAYTPAPEYAVSEFVAAEYDQNPEAPAADRGGYREQLPTAEVSAFRFQAPAAAGAGTWLAAPDDTSPSLPAYSAAAADASSAPATGSIPYEDSAPTAAFQKFVDAPEPEPPAPAPLRVGRAVTSSLRSRREVRTEDKAGQRRIGRGQLLAAAAVGVVALTGLGFGVKALIGSGASGDAAADALAGLPRRSTVTTSGVNYTPVTLKQQVTWLLDHGAPVPAASGTPTASASASGTATSPAAGPAAVPTAGTVAESAVLQSCLGALGEGTSRPVAVDLAFYQGREAAVIVLPRAGGAHDVWVVSRTCGAQGAGELAFDSLTP